jgi:hypothetical protein
MFSRVAKVKLFAASPFIPTWLDAELTQPANVVNIIALL